MHQTDVNLEFTITDVVHGRLWEYGWFDLTRFRVDGAGDTSCDTRGVLEAFFRAPISERSFCSGEPWGTSGRHGPFVAGTVDIKWIRPLTPAEFRLSVLRVLDESFNSLPTNDERKPVRAWMDDAIGRGDEMLMLDAPKDAPRVEWAEMVWWVYSEFFTLRPDCRELAVAVIGFD